MIAVLLIFGISCLCVLHFVVSLLFVLGGSGLSLVLGC